MRCCGMLRSGLAESKGVSASRPSRTSFSTPSVLLRFRFRSIRDVARGEVFNRTLQPAPRWLSLLCLVFGSLGWDGNNSSAEVRYWVQAQNACTSGRYFLTRPLVPTITCPTPHPVLPVTRRCRCRHQYSSTEGAGYALVVRCTATSGRTFCSRPAPRMHCKITWSRPGCDAFREERGRQHGSEGKSAAI